MTRRILIFTAIFLGAITQCYAPTIPVFGSIKPPILLAFALYYALHRSDDDMWQAIFFAAILEDGLSMGSFGPALISFPILTFWTHRVRLEVFSDGLVTQTIFGFSASVMAMIFTIFLYTVTGQRPIEPVYSFFRIIGAGILGLITLPAVSFIMARLESLIPKRRGLGWQ